MQEIELKFRIPAQALAALAAELRALPGGDRPPQRLQAAYFDTDDRKLARARAALRVRQEDDEWVQTLKAAGANAMTRLEDNQPLPPFEAGQPLRPDLSRHTDAHVRQALARDLGWQADEDPRGEQTGLHLLYRTDMRRLRATVHAGEQLGTPGAGQVELALDIGEIAAGDLRQPVQELEIELIDGDARAVLDMGRRLSQQHGLWLDTQTKAHRGDQLAREAASGQPSPTPPARPRARTRPGMTPTQAWLASVDAALDQIGACLSEVALVASPDRQDDASLQASAPWVRGWATGLRRLIRLWRHAPQHHGLMALRAGILQAAQAQYAQLRPRPGHLAHEQAAATLARSPLPTLLALDVLEAIVTAD